jgi:hypothetical protein
LLGRAGNPGHAACNALLGGKDNCAPDREAVCQLLKAASGPIDGLQQEAAVNERLSHATNAFIKQFSMPENADENLIRGVRYGHSAKLGSFLRDRWQKNPAHVLPSWHFAGLGWHQACGSRALVPGYQRGSASTAVRAVFGKGDAARLAPSAE